jgi:redox-sensitive bicupin YhaK (pirin superfamily)
MSAGTGVVHSEINEGDQACRLLQIWIEPSSTGIPPAYEQRPFPPQAGRWTPLVDPERRGGAMAIERPVQLWRGLLEPHQRLAWPQGLAAAAGVWLQLIEGELQAPWALRRGDGLGLAWPAPERSPAPAPLEAAAAGADLLLFALG